MADVAIVITADNRGALTGMKQVGTAAEDIETKSMKAGSALGDIAKIAGGFVVAQGLMKLPGLMNGMANAASDMNETLSKSNTVFKGNAKEIENWADGAAKGFGQSQKQALEAAGSFGNMFTQLGIGTPVAAKMSKSMVELASDFASFHNADITEVLNAQQAAFRGEYDAVQRFVPTINAAAVETQAMAETGKKNAKELTAQEKATAAYTLMLKGAGDALGDFDKTAEGAANKQRILAARMADLQADAGKAILPLKVLALEGLLALADAGEKVVQRLEPMFDAIRSGFTGLGQVSGGPLFELGQALRDVWDFGAKVAGLAWDGLTALAGITWDALKDGAGLLKELAALAWDGLTAGFTAIKDFASAEIAPRLSDIAGSLKDIGASAIDHLGPQFDRLKAAIVGISLKDLSDGFQALRDKVQPAIDALSPLVDRILVALKQQFDDLKEALKPLGPALTDLGEALKPLAPVLGVVIVVAIGALLLAFEGLVRYFGGALTFGIDALVLWIQGITIAIEGVTKVVQEWGPKIGSAFGNVYTTVKANVELIISKLGEIATWLNELPGKMWAIGEKMMGQLFGGINAAFNAGIGAVKEKLNPANWGWRSPLDKSMEYEGREAGAAFVQGIFDEVTGQWKAVEGAVTALMADTFGRDRVTDLMGGGQAILGADGKWYPNEASIPTGIGGASSGPANAFAGQAMLGSDGKWYANEAAMPKGVTGASTTSNGNIASYIGGDQTAALNTAPKVGDSFNGMTWTGSYWSQGGAEMQGPGAQHATITIIQNIGSVGSKGEAAMMMQDGAYALATRGL